MARETDNELIARLAEMSAAGVPLHVGLRAAALDVGPSRTARQLDRLASSLSQAASMESALAELEPQVGAPLRGLIRAGIESGQLDLVLAELVRHERSRREIRHELFNALAYPLTVLVLFLGVATTILLIVVPGLAELFSDFGTELPIPTLIVVWISDSGITLLAQLIAGAAVLALGARFVVGPVAWRRMLISTPMFGPLLQWGGTCEWAALMRVLTNARLPLPDALALAGCAVRDPNMADMSGRLAQATSDGHSLSSSLRNSTHVPLTLGPLIAWGEQNSQLAESFTMAVEIFRGRIYLRGKLLQNILPPLTFIVIAALAVGLVISLVLPLFALLRNLT